MGPDAVRSVPIGDRPRRFDKGRREGIVTTETDLSDVATSQQMPAATRSWRTPGPPSPSICKVSLASKAAFSV